KAAGAVAGAVADNFDKLPEDVRNLLDNLQEHLHNIIKNFSKSSAEWNKIVAIKLILKARTKIDKTFALKILDKLSKDENKEVKIKSVKLISIIQKELKIDKKY
ncbi:MAG: hypothetical protein HF967_01615, partial [Methanosarcinales archaeon]|nr:hypothetical protein [Methanosarcinales archaeon]